MATDQLNSYCAKRDERPFLIEGTERGIPVILDFGSTLVAACYSDKDVVHFPRLGIDGIPVSLLA